MGWRRSDMFCARFPGCMTDGVIILRYIKISDGPFLRKQLAERDALSYTELSRPISASWFYVWLKMKKIFHFAYIIVVDSKPAGFIGLYNLIPGQSAGMSLVIFDKEKRGRGYGRRAFNLLAYNLQEYSMVRSIFVSYKSNNTEARSFLSRCGFQEKCRQDNSITMFKDLD
jgi:RimJ/RimL family protein N-acetyltransferase